MALPREQVGLAPLEGEWRGRLGEGPPAAVVGSGDRRSMAQWPAAAFAPAREPLRMRASRGRRAGEAAREWRERVRVIDGVLSTVGTPAVGSNTALAATRNGEGDRLDDRHRCWPSAAWLCLRATLAAPELARDEPWRGASKFAITRDRPSIVTIHAGVPAPPNALAVTREGRAIAVQYA